MKKHNGITLIALIITIIVMMILVGVTVSVALNGGLFDTARNAGKDTQIEADKEELQAALVGAYDAVAGTVDGAKLKSNLPVWTVEGAGPYTCTSANGNAFTVNLDGIIEIGNSNSGGEEPEILEFPYGTYFAFGDETKLLFEEGYMLFGFPIKVTEMQLGEQNTVNISAIEDDESVSNEFKYVHTENNTMIVAYNDIFTKTEEDIVWDLEGEYISSDGLEKYTFTAGTEDINYFKRSNLSSDWYSEYILMDYYFSLAGKYFTNTGEEIIFSDGYKTFTIGGVTYTNESASSAKTIPTVEEVIPTNLDFIYGTFFNRNVCWGLRVTESEILVGDTYFLTTVLCDEDTSTMTITILDEEDDPVAWKYIKEGKDVILWSDRFSGVYGTSDEAFELEHLMNLDLSGDYIRSDGYYKLSFTAGSLEVYCYDKREGSWVNSNEEELDFYLELNGEYYWAGEDKMYVNEDKTSLTIDGKDRYTYTKAE